jgi:hypothetical protein
MTTKELEKYSSAFTMSDMEVFIFPELLFSMVLANIMSPEIWKWKDEKWFSSVSKMTPLKKIQRVKQFIMDHYTFNLDLETWGLTDKQTEINRFSDFLDAETLEKSNALFGYEGDKYYFSMDIRKHFGLDKFDSDIIPYWKTETIDAMNAFRFKPGYESGAGECVSLACLYAAALFIVAEIPLEKIFMMGTPLHSQNFIMAGDGILTNNRRVLTKSMWFNGTELSSLARRALEHEQVTVVAHLTGYIHSVFPEATIDQEEYRQFRDKLSKFLETKVTFEIFLNFLRDYSSYQRLFQIAFPCRGSKKYIRLEKAFGYEHGTKNRLGDKTGDAMLCDLDEDEMQVHSYDDRIILSKDDELFSSKPFAEFLTTYLERFPELGTNQPLLNGLKKFFHTVPKLPSPQKQYSPVHHLTISPTQTREEIITYLSGIRSQASGFRPQNSVIDLAFYAGRYMNEINWQPFLKAAFERNPVSLGYFKDLELETIYHELNEWPIESIYDGERLALPDEVVNFKRGDGIEKMITFMNVVKSRNLDLSAEQHGEKLIVRTKDQKFMFETRKKITIPKSDFFL